MIRYIYNARGLRSSKTADGLTTYFVYNGMNLVYEYYGNYSNGISYHYGLNRTNNNQGDIYIYNAHGDIVQIFTGYVYVTFSYDAFGNITSQVGDNYNNNPFFYCGEYFDSESETYYLRARYYNPANGRFTQQDGWGYMNPNDPLSLNLYTYCANNPVMYVDPSGRSPVDIVAGVVWALGESMSGGLYSNIISAITDTSGVYSWEDEADYYLGRVIGGILAEGIGAVTTIRGILEIIASFGAGGVITLGSGGTATIAGVSVCIEGVAIGAAEVGYGATIMASAASGLGGDWDSYKEAKTRETNPSKNESEIWKSFDKIKGSSRKTSGHGKNKKYYDWDYTHNDIEVYDHKGKHLGSMDPTTGEMYKPAKLGRQIKI